MNRRKVLTTAISTTTLAAAGCAEENNSDNEETENESEESESICEVVMETSHHERQSQRFEVEFNQYIRVTIRNISGFRTRVTLNHETEGLIFGESVDSEDEQLFRVHDPDHEYGIVEELTGTWEAHYEPHNNELDTNGYVMVQVCDGAFDVEQ